MGISIDRGNSVSLNNQIALLLEGDQLTYSHDPSKLRRGSFGRVIPLTGTTTNGSAVITGLSSTASLSVGMAVIGTGIGAAPNAIVSIDSATQVTLLVNSTASAAVTITFANTTRAFNGGTTNGNKIITGLASTANLSVGHLVTGTGIGAAPNYIASIDSATQVTLTVDSTATATVKVTFTSQLYSLLGGVPGSEAMEFVSHSFGIDENGNFKVWDETGTGMLTVIKENNYLVTYGIASLVAGVLPVAANFTLKKSYDIIGNYEYSSINSYGGFTAAKVATGTTQLQAYSAELGSGASAGTPVQMSPYYQYIGGMWDTTTATGKLVHFRTDVLPVSGATAAIGGSWRLTASVDGAAHASVLEVTDLGGLVLRKTITASGTTGAQTINKPAGRVNIAAAGTSVVVTNSLVTANSIIIAVAATADATARVTSVVPAAGSFTINTVSVTAETAFNFLVVS